MLTIPESLWSHPLFKGSAEFVPPSFPLTVATLDERVRRLRNMPSTGDESANLLLSGLARIQATCEKWMETLPATSQVSEYYVLKAKFQRLIRAIDSGLAVESILSMINGIQTKLSPDILKYFSLSASDPAAIRRTVDVMQYVVLDGLMLSLSPELRRKYLKQSYRVVDKSLELNATTGSARMIPVLGWLKQIVWPATGLSYVDVGCSIKGGAPGLVLASSFLRNDSFCTTIHGTDVTSPSKQIQRDFVRDHRILLYQSNPVIRPLPMIYDIILLANMHRHLTIELQKKLMANVSESLSERGVIIVNWRFGPNRNQSICLKRVNRQLHLVADGNTI